MRREPLHPGAQTSPFPDLEFRYWGHYTDAEGDPVELDVHMRAHARVQDHIRRLKASGLERLPFSDLEANQAWLASICFATDLVRRLQLLCPAGRLAAAEPRPCAGSCGTPQLGSCAAPAGASCACSTAGPPPGIC